MGSLFAALTTAVSGLNAQSSAIGNISENLANAQTTGYKTVGTQFSQLVNASSATVNNPGGVTATPEYQNDVQGSIVSASTSTYMAISGAGYFQVEKASTDASGNTVFSSQNYYTRNGNFTLDKNGYMVNGSGYYLTGYVLDSTGTLNTSTTAPIQISALLNDPVAAQNIYYSANLPSNAAVGYTSASSTISVYDALGNANDVSYTWTKTGSNTWDLNISAPGGTDSNGKVYNATIPYTFNNGTNGTAGTIESMTAYTASTPKFTVNSAPTGNMVIGNVSIPWSYATSGSANVTVPVTLTSSSGATSTVNLSMTGLLTASTPTAYASNMAAILNAAAGSSAISSSYGISGMTATAATGTISLSTIAQNVTPDSGGVSTEVSWGNPGTDGVTAANGTVKELFSSPYGTSTPETSGSSAAATMAVTFGSTTAQTIKLNFGTYGGSSGVTQFATTDGTLSVSNFSQDGLASGSFNSLSIDNSGNVSINYSNGTNKIIAQIPIAQFYAQDQLQQVTGGAYTSTLASGNARLTTAGSNGAGTVSAQSLEQSNVDISTEFTNLIQAQQVYSANAKVVSTDNQMLQVTLNMLQ